MGVRLHPRVHHPYQKINRSHAHAHDSRTHDSRTNHSHEHRANNGATTLKKSTTPEEEKGRSEQRLGIYKILFHF